MFGASVSGSNEVRKTKGLQEFDLRGRDQALIKRLQGLRSPPKAVGCSSAGVNDSHGPHRQLRSMCGAMADLVPVRYALLDLFQLSWGKRNREVRFAVRP